MNTVKRASACKLSQRHGRALGEVVEFEHYSVRLDQIQRLQGVIEDLDDAKIIIVRENTKNELHLILPSQITKTGILIS